MEQYKGLHANKAWIINADGKELRTGEPATFVQKGGVQGIDDQHYEVVAYDQNGQSYAVYWNPVQNYMNIDNESLRCNWDKPDNVVQL